MNTRLSLWVFICAAAFLMVSCGEEEIIEPELEDTTNEELETAMQDAIIMNNVVNQTNQEFEVMALTVGSTCPEVTFTELPDLGATEAMVEYAFNFGPGCTANGITRTGTAWIRDSMFVLDNSSPRSVQVRRGISYIDYSEDNLAISGYSHEVYEGQVFDPTGFGPLSWLRDSLFLQAKTQDLNFGYPDGTSASSFSQETFELDPTCWPSSASPFYVATRNKFGQTRTGSDYYIITMTNLIQQQSCQYPAGGQIGINLNDKMATFQYGQCACNVDQSQCGCDDKGQLTLPSGETKIVTIKKWW
ncbi:MAG: hypothetical protein AAGH79_04030 [Bacteroidota bacterium]